MKTTIQTPSCA